jgi:hypothetical protein
MFTGNTETNTSVAYDDSDGTLDVVTTLDGAPLTTEAVQDIVGAMMVGTETRIGVSYDDTNGEIDFVVDNMVQAVAYASAISEGNSGLVPSAGTSGHFLKHDGTFGIPAYTTNTNTTSVADVYTAMSGDPGGNFVIGNQSSDTATFTGPVVVSGNFTVNGTTTTISTANLEVEDKMVILGTPDSPFADDATAATAQNAGGIALYTDSAGTEGNFAKITWSATGDLTGWQVEDTQAGKITIAAMEFSTNSTAPTGDAVGIGSLHYDSGDDKLYIRTV